MTRLALFTLAILALSSVISTDAAFAAAKKTSNNTGPTVDRVLAACDALDGLNDILAALLDVVVGPDRDRLDLALRADHMLQR